MINDIPLYEFYAFRNELQSKLKIGGNINDLCFIHENGCIIIHLHNVCYLKGLLTKEMLENFNQNKYSDYLFEVVKPLAKKYKIENIQIGFKSYTITL